MSKADIGLIGLAVMVILAREATEKKGASGKSRKGFSLVILAMLFGAVAVISSKFAAMHTHKLAFIALLKSSSNHSSLK